jgi:hypothetical protein
VSKGRCGWRRRNYQSRRGIPFYTRLNALLDAAGFDRFAEGQCVRFYAPVMGRPSLASGRYFRLLLVGYFEAGFTRRCRGTLRKKQGWGIRRMAEGSKTETVDSLVRLRARFEAWSMGWRDSDLGDTPPA